MHPRLTHTKRVALVIGSGAIKSVTALGLAEVLAKENIKPDLIVGCSAGAIFGACLAAGHDAATAIEMSRKLWTREVTCQQKRFSLLRALFPKLLRFGETFGLRCDRLLLSRLEEAFGELLMEELAIPLAITATDFHTGERVVLTQGRVVDAIRASISLPFFFQPWQVEDRLLVDGCVSDPLPIDVASAAGAQVIVAMGFECEQQKRIRTPLRLAFQFSSLVSNNLLHARLEAAKLAHPGEVIALLPRFEKSVRLFDTAMIPYLVDEGRRAAHAILPRLRRSLGLETGAPMGVAEERGGAAG